MRWGIYGGHLWWVGTQELNRIFVRSDRLNSEAIVEFVRALCMVAREELRVHGAPRVYSLNKIVEIAHFNMGRIRCASFLPRWPFG